MIMSGSVLLGIKNVSDKIVQKIKTHVSCSITFLLENRAVCEITLKNVIERGTPQVAIQYGACALYAGYLRPQTRTQNM